MKNIVIDINIFMDFLFKREGHENVAEIFRLCACGDIKGFACAHEITTLYYFLDKTIADKRKIKKVLAGIMKNFAIIEINEKLLNKALGSNIGDFEDAVIEVSASDRKAEYILTGNIKDFKKSIVQAIAPEELIGMLKNFSNSRS